MSTSSKPLPRQPMPRQSMSRKQKRLVVIAGLGLVLVAAVGLILTALNNQITFFRSPTDVISGKVRSGDNFRLGGLVETGSVQKEEGQLVRFRITDGANTVVVAYRGLLPDLFREGQGVITEGKLDPAGQFTATNVLAKHDENYMPREVADTLKAQGVWKEPGKPGVETKSGAETKPGAKP